MNKNKTLRRYIGQYIESKTYMLLSIIFFSIIFSISVASADRDIFSEKSYAISNGQYFWDRTTGISIAGYATNWTSCSSSSPQNGFRITSIGTSTSSCTNGALIRTTVGDMFLEILPTIYTSSTQITGINTTFYLERPNSGTTTYRIDLGYVQTGVFTSFGYVTRSLTSSGTRLATTNMNTIGGTAPAGSNLAMKLSVTTLSSRQTAKVNLGKNGGSTGSNSGRFYVRETTSTPAPLSIVAPADITIGATGTYTTVNLGTLAVTGGTSPYITTNNSPPGGFLVGTTTVTWNTTDSVGTKATDIQLVTITPQTPAPGGYKIIVSSDRYSIFSPWTGKASDTSLSANITGYALLLDGSGKPVSGQSITFKIYSGSGGTILKSTKTAITQVNGLASVPYDTYADFSTSTDADYGTWKIEAYLTSDPTVIGNTGMKIEAGGDGLSGGNGCETYCHETSSKTGAKPLSPYTAGYGTTSSRAAAAHEKSNHINKGCYYCHPGYATVKTGSYGNTGDVHKNRTCDYCHGTWSYISSTTTGNGNGIPKMPSCYSCHPVLNSNPSNVSTIANLVGGIGISVYSFNFDQKKPLTAHTGTTYSLVDSVPCLVCHGPAHNNSKLYSLASSSNGNTENEQCWSCHTNRATTHKYNTNCVGCHSQNAHNVSTSGGGGPDCISCHDSTGSAPKLVNFSVANISAHKNLNSGASSTVNAENKKCWACHGDGTQPISGHPANYKTPSPCENCHTGTGTFGAPLVREHIQNGSDVKTAVNCSLCHDNNGMYLDSGGVGTITHYLKDVTNTATIPYGHLGPIDTSNCLICHNGIYTGDPIWGSPINITTSLKRVHTETSNAQCDACHKDGTIQILANVDFHNSSLTGGTGQGPNCLACHAGNE